MLTMTDNRITRAISSMTENIAKRIAEGLTTQAAVDKTHGELDMDLGEYCKFQELKSLASTNGALTVDEAQTVYMMIGESVETFNTLPIAAKVILTKLFSELLSRRISQKMK